MIKVLPCFLENSIPIVFSIDQNYAPYLSVCLLSLIKNSSINNNYDIWILDGGLLTHDKERLLDLIGNRKNVSIRFFDISQFKEIKRKRFFVSNHASVANYYRLFLPKIFFNYNKILYLDCDLLICHDIVELYNINIKDNMFGACRDCCTYFDPQFWLPYCYKKLNIHDAHQYINSGVLICNIQQMIKDNFTKKCLESLKDLKPVCWDQDVLNKVYQGKIFYLPLIWNYQWHWNLPEFQKNITLPILFEKEYKKATASHYILHYTSHKKAWNRWSAKESELWWNYAHESNFLPDIIERNKTTSIPQKSFNNLKMNNKSEISKIKTSIIVPVYNVDKYLSRCLESLINQTLKDIEILCVNDESTDGSLEILEKFSRQDQRIIVISQKKSGQGSARNRGIEIARGKYIQFCDSDDYFEPNCCERMYEIMEGNDVDVACFQPNVIYDAYSFRRKEDTEYFSLKYNKLNPVIPPMALNLDVNCWNKIFRKSFIDKNNLRFPENLHFEDVGFFWFWICKATTIYCIHENLYNYVRRPNSFVSEIFEKRQKDMLDSFAVNKLIFEYLKSHTRLELFENEFVVYCINKLKWHLAQTQASDISIKQKGIDMTADILKMFRIEQLDISKQEKDLFDLILNKKYYALKCGSCVDITDVKAAFQKNNIPIVFATDRNYVAPLSVAIQSIVCNISTTYNYDILVLYSDLYDYQKRMLLDIAEGTRNVKIRFINMSDLSKKRNLNSLVTINHISAAAYFRLLSASIFKAYEKIIYLDSDVVILEDIAKLYAMDLEGKSIAACRDTVVSMGLDNVIIKDGFIPYCKNVLGMPSIENYFNTGVLLINIKKWNELAIENKLLLYAEINNRFFHDQNVLNAVFFNDVLFLESKWNLQYHIKFQWVNYHSKLPEDIIELYDNLEVNPAIIHYTSSKKPWNEMEHTYTSVWWKYARKSPFYEIIVANYMRPNRNSTLLPLDLINMLRDARNYRQYKIRYYYYKLFSKITFGKTRKQYEEMRKIYKEKIRNSRSFLKDIS